MLLRRFWRSGTVIAGGSLALCGLAALAGCSGPDHAPFVDGTHLMPGAGGDGTPPDDMTMTGDGSSGAPGDGTPLGTLDPNEVYLVGYLNDGQKKTLGVAPVIDTREYSLTVPSPKYPSIVDHRLLYMDDKIWEMVADYTGSDQPAEVTLPKSPQANDVKSTSKCPSGSTVVVGIPNSAEQLLYICTDTNIYMRNQKIETVEGFNFIALGHDDLGLGMLGGVLTLIHLSTNETQPVEGNPAILPVAARASEGGFSVAWVNEALELIEVSPSGATKQIKKYPDPIDPVTLDLMGYRAKLDAKGNLYVRAFGQDNPDQVLVYKFPIENVDPAIVYDSLAEGQTLLLTEDYKETPLVTGP